MTGAEVALLAVGVLALACLVLAAAVVGARRRAARMSGELADLRRRLDELERPPSPEAADVAPRVGPAPVEFLITDLGRGSQEPTAPPLPAPAFADIVLKETVVKAASLVHGGRRGLEPATRNRIRFEMRQEVRRSRKQRRADLRTAQRDLHSRQRAALAEEAR